MEVQNLEPKVKTAYCKSNNFFFLGAYFIYVTPRKYVHFYLKTNIAPSVLPFTEYISILQKCNKKNNHMQDGFCQDARKRTVISQYISIIKNTGFSYYPRIIELEVTLWII